MHLGFALRRKNAGKKEEKGYFIVVISTEMLLTRCCLISLEASGKSKANGEPLTRLITGGGKEEVGEEMKSRISSLLSAENDFLPGCLLLLYFLLRDLNGRDFMGKAISEGGDDDDDYFRSLVSLNSETT